MLMAKLLALAICVLLFYETAAQVEVGFEQADYAAREGRDGEFFLRLYIGDLANDVVLRLRPLTVSGFENYRNENPSRTFAQSILDDVAAISDPAEYEQKLGGRRDFNNSVFSIVFPFSVDEVEVEVTKSLIFDDDVNEVNEEGFVIVLEIEQSNPADSVTLYEGRDVLFFYICDNDDISLGFEMTSFIFPESIGVLDYNTFNIEKLNNQESEVNIAIIVNIMQDSSNSTTSAIADEDFRLVSGDQYEYMVQLKTDQQTVSVDPIEIVDDLFAEENETFVLSLSPGPDAALFNYQIMSNKNLVTVLITDDDSISIGFDRVEQNVTEGTNSTVEVCFSLQQGSLESSSATLIVDISPNGTSTGALLVEDYQLAANPQQLTIKSGQTSVCFNVTIVDDNIELTECFTLMAVVSSASIMSYTVTEGETLICITDNDGMSGGAGGFSVDYVHVIEGVLGMSSLAFSAMNSIIIKHKLSEREFDQTTKCFLVTLGIVAIPIITVVIIIGILFIIVVSPIILIAICCFAAYKYYLY